MTAVAIIDVEMEVAMAEIDVEMQAHLIQNLPYY